MVAKDVELLRLPLADPHVDVSLLDLAQLMDTESAASRFLTREESAEYTRLRHPWRRREWLGARICLKTILLRRGCVTDPIQCRIVKDASGRPRVSFESDLPSAAVYDCSLSHKASFACACASSMAETRVGLDIERISPRLARLAGAFVNGRDSLIGGYSEEVGLAVLWCLKEACSKAVGLGWGIGLANVICEETAAGRHKLKIENGPTCGARHLVYQGYVIALCLVKEDDKESYG